MRQTNPVEFSTTQLEYLESVFPQCVLQHSHTEAQMRHYFGTQAVIDVVRGRTRGLSKERTQRVQK